MMARLTSWIIFLASLLCGCAAVPLYSVSVTPIGPAPSPPWFGDGPDITIVVRNRSAEPKRFWVRCAGAPDWLTDPVPARGELRAMGQLTAVNTRGDACDVVAASSPDTVVAEVLR